MIRWEHVRGLLSALKQDGNVHSKYLRKGKAREEKQLSSLMKKNFSCEHDALTRLEEFKRELKYNEIKDYQINTIAQHSDRGAHKKDTEPDGDKYTITAIDICFSGLKSEMKMAVKNVYFVLLISSWINYGMKFLHEGKALQRL